MPRKTCYWTRKLELELVNFIREREFIWRPVGNTNYHIQQKYKAYAEFAASLGRGFTARSVRDRWVNIRSTFHHNLRKVTRSKRTAQTSADVYVPCWALWKPLQFLKDVPKKEETQLESTGFKDQQLTVKKETQSDVEDIVINIRQRSERTTRPLKRQNIKAKSNKCVQILDDLITAMKPLVKDSYPEQSYWFFGKHVTERLNCMRDVDANCARRDIMDLLNEWEKSTHT